MATTKIFTSLPRQSTHRSQSSLTQVQFKRKGSSSEGFMHGKNQGMDPVVDEIRKARAEYYAKEPPVKRRTSTAEDPTPPSPSREDSESEPSEEAKEESEGAQQGVRRRYDSQHQHHSRRRRQQSEDKEEGTVQQVHKISDAERGYRGHRGRRRHEEEGMPEGRHGEEEFQPRRRHDGKEDRPRRRYSEEHMPRKRRGEEGDRPRTKHRDEEDKLRRHSLENNRPRRRHVEETDKPRRKHCDEEGDLRVHKSGNNNTRDASFSRPRTRRRSTDTGEANRTRRERPSLDDKGINRRQSEQKSSRYKEHDPTARRGERRSASDQVMREVKYPPPIARSVSDREPPPLSIFPRSLLRSLTSARKAGPRSVVSSTISHMGESAEKVRIVKRTERVGKVGQVEKAEKIEKGEKVAQVENTPSIAASTTRSIAKKGDRSSGVKGSVFGSAKPAEPPRPVKKVECVVCMDDETPITKCAKLGCSHYYCHGCLRAVFELSIKDPTNMPPKCCTADCIPLKHVEKLFDTKFKKHWNQKFQEYTTENRMYCPAKGCGQWIPPSNIKRDRSGGPNTGKKYGTCTRCQTKACCTCNEKWHKSRECPKDPSTQKFLETAEREGWQRCFNCKIMVEKTHGCNHMSCTCGADFCIVCGSRWKTCNCVWFEHEAIEADRMRHLNDLPRMPGGYREEMDYRREQERIDQEMARLLDEQMGAHRMGMDDFGRPYMDGGGLVGLVDDGYAIGNAAGHFLNDNFVNPGANFPNGARRPDREDYADRLIAEAMNYELPWLRGNNPASRQNDDNYAARPSERTVPRRMTHNYHDDAERHRPFAGRAHSDHDRRASLLAGITRDRGAGNRVDGWRRHVDPFVYEHG